MSRWRVAARLAASIDSPHSTGESPMSTEANKAIVRRLVEEGINQSNESLFLDLLSPDVVDHYTRPGLPPGRAGWNLFRKLFQAAFPDGCWTIADIVAEGDLVAARTAFTGTHLGEFMGI